MRFYENPLCVQENRLPQRAYYIPENEGAYTLLNGQWDFKYYESDFLEEAEITAWDRLPVPSCWQLFGYDHPNYLNKGYPIPLDPPYVPDDDPMGVYRRFFTLPQGFDRFYLVFEGAATNLELFVNGSRVGYSQGSRLQAEFDVTDFVHPGENELRVRIRKWCSGSYMEDQDCFRFNGIFRDVYLLSRPEGHIRDIHITTENDTVFVDFDGKAAVSLFDAGKLLQKTEAAGHAEFTVENPVLWNAEKPYLYTLRFEYAGEVISRKFGFVSYTVNAESAFCVNGVPVKLKGVNHHDTHPEKGYCESDADLLNDLRQMKKLNINTIRTSHYPPTPRFLDFCDEMGFYVMLETDLEQHGFSVTKQWVELRANEKWIGNHPDWKNAHVERMERAYERDKNHPCIFSWSIGNECGHGKNHEAMVEYLRRTDSKRLIHSEDVSRISKELPELYRETDLYSRMYPSFEEIEEYVQDPEKTLPMFYCEYSHAMGNGPGDVGDYWEVIWQHPQLIGGCIWEWTDHTVLVNGVPHYGGDFHEMNHASNFCMDGLTFCDRSFKAGSLNAKAAYQPLRCTLDGTKLTLTNLFDFTDLNEYTLTVECVTDGQTVEEKTLRIDLPPKASEVLELPAPKANRLGAFVNVSMTDASGWEVAACQLPMQAEHLPYAAAQEPAQMSATKDEFIAEGKNFRFAVSRHHGEISSIRLCGEEQLTDRVHLTVRRAPIDNERKITKLWYFDVSTAQAEGLDRLFHKCYSCTMEGNTVTVHGALSGISHAPLLRYRADYSFFADGSMTVSFSADVREDAMWLPRLGFEFRVPYENDRFRYFGRGPMENYRDMKLHTRMDFFESTADAEFVNYPMPQEHGNHTDVHLLELGTGLLFTSEPGFECNVSHYSAEKLAHAMHTDELEQEKDTVIRIDWKNSGVGSGSCGPQMLEKYRLSEKHIEGFRFTLAVR